MFKIKTITGDYSEILLSSIKEQIGSLDCFKLSDSRQIEKIIKKNYKNVNDETLYKAIYKIMLFNLDEKFNSQKRKEKIDLCDLTDVKTEYIRLCEFLKIKYF